MRASVVALLANHSINTTRPLMPDAPSVAGKTEAAVCGDSKMLSWPARRRPSSIQHCWRGAGTLSSRPSSAARAPVHSDDDRPVSREAAPNTRSDPAAREALADLALSFVRDPCAVNLDVVRRD